MKSWNGCVKPAPNTKPLVTSEEMIILIKQGLSYEGRSPSNSNSLPGGKGLKGWGVVVSLIMIDHKTVYSWSVEIENIARIQLTCEVRLEELQ